MCSLMYRFNDIDVAGTTTQVALYRSVNAGICDLLARAKQVVGSHDHSGCAKAALQSVAAFEGFLKRMQAAC